MYNWKLSKNKIQILNAEKFYKYPGHLKLTNYLKFSKLDGTIGSKGCHIKQCWLNIPKVNLLACESNKYDLIVVLCVYDNS